MKPVEPFEIHRPVVTGKPNWAAIGTSVLLHLLVIALLILRPPEGTGPKAPPHQADGSEPQPISMPLPALPKQAQKQPTPPPPPPVKEQILGPESKKPDPIPQEAIAPHPPAEPVPDPAGAVKAADPVQPDPKTAPPDPAAPEAKASHFPTLGEMLATRSRLNPPTSDNGQPKTVVDPNRGGDAPAAASRASASASAMGRSGLSNEDYREWRPSFPEDRGGCAEIPDLGKNPDGSPVLATVNGYVYDTDGRTPIPDAHLQILGTAFVTFTDAKGYYRLEFDPHLLTKCRKQYVRVVAAGHESQQLMLAIGRKIQSDDVHLRRH